MEKRNKINCSIKIQPEIWEELTRVSAKKGVKKITIIEAALIERLKKERAKL